MTSRPPINNRSRSSSPPEQEPEDTSDYESEDSSPAEQSRCDNNERGIPIPTTPSQNIKHRLTNKSANRSKSTNNSIKSSNDEPLSKPWSRMSLVLMASLCLCLYFFYDFIVTQRNDFTIQDSVDSCTYSDLRTKYPNESDYLWNSLISGIENIVNNPTNKPDVYLFVHSGGNSANALIRDIAITSSSCFDPSTKVVEIQKVDFTSADAVEDYGIVIEKYKQRIKEGSVILIANLNEIPAKAARALHAICDTYSPIVPRVMIILSLVAEHKTGIVTDTAVDALEQLWKAKIPDNELDPLITRVTNQAILLQSI